jgi:hypothetical protein
MSLAACIFSTQAIRISLWPVQAISSLAIFYAARASLIPRMQNGNFPETEKRKRKENSYQTVGADNQRRCEICFVKVVIHFRLDATRGYELALRPGAAELRPKDFGRSHT